MALQVKEYVQVAGRAAQRAGLALAGILEAHPVVHAGADLDGELAHLARAALAVAGRHGVGMICPRPLQREQGAVVANVPKMVCCVCRTCPKPPQATHGCGWVPGAAPLPLQVSQFSTRGMRAVFSAP
jgi:hypothetical protein